MEERKSGNAHRAAMLERSFVGHRPFGVTLVDALGQSLGQPQGPPPMSEASGSGALVQ